MDIKSEDSDDSAEHSIQFQNRNKEIEIASIAGVFINFILFVSKIVLGLLSNSIALFADGINNFSDFLTTVIAFICGKISKKPPNEKYPYGYARIEYIAEMVISAIMLFAGFELLKKSILNIFNQEYVDVNFLIILVLVISVVCKLLIFAYYKQLDTKFNTPSLKAISVDSRNDAISSLLILFGLLIETLFNIHTDAYVGTIVSLLILFSAFVLIKDSVDALLGEAPSDSLLKNIEDICLSFREVIDIHELLIHEYGPGKVFATFHVELKKGLTNTNILIDKIEERLNDELGVDATIHIDFVDQNSSDYSNIVKIIKKKTKSNKLLSSFNDIRIIPGANQTDVVFDIVVKKNKEIDVDAIELEFDQVLKKYNKNLVAVINDVENIGEYYK